MKAIVLSLAARVLPSAVMILSACGSPSPGDKPSIELVRIVEGMLQQDVCLRNLGNLRRVYRYAVRDRKIRHDLIDAEISEPGFGGPAGFYIQEAEPDRMIIDDRQYFMAAALYHIPDHALDLWACGMNRGAFFRHPPRF